MSRQFVDMTRIRIEGLLAAFPKLVGTGKQHTYVETDNVRYVYQPLEGVYLVLITNKNSNILEDLETLRTLSKLVPEYCGVGDEESITLGAFDLLFAFDEAISMGLKENVTVPQVRQYTEMDSHEEKLHKMILESKVNETKQQMKAKALQIDKSKVEAKLGGGLGGIGAQGMGGGGMGRGFGMDDPFAGMGMGAPPVRPSPMGGSSFGGSGLGGSHSGGGAGGSGGRAPPKAGLKLGAKKGTNAFLDALKADTVDLSAEEAVAGGPALPAEPITINVEEHVSVDMTRDGALNSMEVQGTMTLEVYQEDSACVRVHVEQGEACAGFQLKTHPNIDKKLFSGEGVLGLKQPDRPFPIGTALGVLKWRRQTSDESAVPLTINCWPSVSGSETYVNVEYETNGSRDLHNTVIAIPIPPCRDPPQVTQVDGDYRYDARQGVLFWDVGLIDASNTTGSMEIVLATQADESSVFPITCNFDSVSTFIDLAVTKIVGTADEAPVKYGGATRVIVDSYSIE